jgi:hypothetical protein
MAFDKKHWTHHAETKRSNVRIGIVFATIGLVALGLILGLLRGLSMAFAFLTGPKSTQGTYW